MTQDEVTQKSNEIFPILHYLHENGEFENVIKDLRKKFKKMAKKKKVAKPVVKPNDLTPKQVCEAAHAGEQGYCDVAGVWHPGI